MDENPEEGFLALLEMTSLTVGLSSRNEVRDLSSTLFEGGAGNRQILEPVVVADLLSGLQARLVQCIGSELDSRVSLSR
jgi:uncharacterized Fe-S center protein